VQDLHSALAAQSSGSGMKAGLPCPQCRGSCFWQETLLGGPELICLQCGLRESEVDLSSIEDMAREFTAKDQGSGRAATLSYLGRRL